MSFDLGSIFSEMGAFAIVIVSALGLMAVTALAVSVERSWVLWRTRRRSAAFARTSCGTVARTTTFDSAASPVFFTVTVPVNSWFT